MSRRVIAKKAPQRASVGEKRRENKAVKMACIRGWLNLFEA